MKNEIMRLVDSFESKAINKHYHPTTGTIHEYDEARAALLAAVEKLVAPQPTELTDEFESLLARAEVEPHASPNLVNVCRTARAVLAAMETTK